MRSHIFAAAMLAITTMNVSAQAQLLKPLEVICAPAKPNLVVPSTGLGELIAGGALLVTGSSTLAIGTATFIDNDSYNNLYNGCYGYNCRSQVAPVTAIAIGATQIFIGFILIGVGISLRTDYNAWSGKHLTATSSGYVLSF